MMTIPRGIKNNNPGNIDRNATKWQGMAEDQSGDPRFIVFTAPEYGIRAIAKLLLTYGTKYGIDTVRGAIQRWAPPNENDTEAYIHHVCDRLGVTPEARVNLASPSVLVALVAAVIKHENGVQPYDETTIAKGVDLALGVKTVEV